MTAKGTKRRRVLTTLAVVLSVQVLAAIGYHFVESQRSRQSVDERFHYEVVSGPRELRSAHAVRRDGSRAALHEMRGKPVLLHFWATWCLPCRDELPDLLKLADEEPRIQVLAVAVNDDWEPVDLFFGGTVPQQVVRDPPGSLVKALGIGALPDTYLLDRNGVPQLRFSGPRLWRSTAARAALARYVAAPR